MPLMHESSSDRNYVRFTPFRRDIVLLMPGDQWVLDETSYKLALLVQPTKVMFHKTE